MSAYKTAAAGLDPHDGQGQTGLPPIGYPSRPLPSTAKDVTMDQAVGVLNAALTLWERLEVDPWTADYGLSYSLQRFQHRIWDALHRPVSQ